MTKTTSSAVRRLAPVVMAAALFLSPNTTAAHSLGSFAVDADLDILVGPTGVTLAAKMRLGEMPTLAETRRLDADHDGEVSDAERVAFEKDFRARLNESLTVEIGESPVVATPIGFSLRFPLGPTGLPELEVRAHYLAAWPAGLVETKNRSLRVRAGLTLFRDAVGLRRVKVAGQPRGSARYKLLRDGPPGAPRAWGAEVVYRPPEGTTILPGVPVDSPTIQWVEPPAGAPAETTTSPGSEASPLVTLLRRDSLDAPIIAGGLLLALLLGALHALSPGHGKTMVAGYLVGSRGRVRDAVILGLIVTFTHVSSVILLGLIFLPLTEYVLPATVVPAITAVSGAVVLMMGLWLLRRRLRDARHGHSHAHSHALGHDHRHGHAHPHGAPGAPVRARDLFLLGVSGGMVPCPTALVVMLIAVSTGRVALGLLLIAAFSLGLAAVLVAIGVLTVRASALVSRWTGEGALLRWLGVAGAGAVAAVGALIIASVFLIPV